MPRKKSESAKRMTGTQRADRARADANIEPLEALPRVPVDLQTDARPVWKELGQRCVERRTLTVGDLNALRLAAEAVVAHRRCMAVVEQEGQTATGSKGQIVVHPLLAEARQWQNAARVWLTVLGLTPASRSLVERIPEAPKPSKGAWILDKVQEVAQ